MGKWTGKSCRLIAMLCLTFGFFVVEIVVGYATGSLALVADSFHMLSDVVALIVGLVSVRVRNCCDFNGTLCFSVLFIILFLFFKYSRRGASKKNTFGWARAEVLGAMVNAVFLVALCFTILVEAIQRMIHTEQVNDPILLIIVGGIGLLINVVGLLMFHNDSHGHGHSHGGHGHSHGGKKTDGELKNSKEHEKKPLNDEENGGTENLSDSENEITIGPVLQKDGSTKNVTYTKDPNQASSAQLNMRGVFLHVLGDALGSVVVIISAIIYLTLPKVCVTTSDIKSTTEAAINATASNSTCAGEFKLPQWVDYVDPSLSIVLVSIILSTSLPLLKDSAMILLQTVPTHIVVSTMQSEIEKLDGVLEVHEFHVWSLAGDKIVASLHLHLRSLDDYVRVSNEVKEYFHDEGIHSVTIQPEFLDLHLRKAGRNCSLECGPDKSCHALSCCVTNNKPLANGSHPSPTDKTPEAKPMENEINNIELTLTQPQNYVENETA